MTMGGKRRAAGRETAAGPAFSSGLAGGREGQVWLKNNAGNTSATGKSVASEERTSSCRRRTSQASDVQFADYLNNTPKLIVSRTLREVGWRNSRLIKGDVVQELTKLKQQPGKNITILGSATLVRSLLRNGLLDELGLMIFPVVLSAGRRLFENDVDQIALKLVQARTFGTGVVGVTYETTTARGSSSSAPELAG